MSIINKIKNENMGFITEKELPELIKENRFAQCIVRCGNGRFICPAQDVAHFVEIIGKSDLDYVRDVSLKV